MVVHEINLFLHAHRTVDLFLERNDPWCENKCRPVTTLPASFEGTAVAALMHLVSCQLANAKAVCLMVRQSLRPLSKVSASVRQSMWCTNKLPTDCSQPAALKAANTRKGLLSPLCIPPCVYPSLSHGKFRFNGHMHRKTYDSISYNRRHCKSPQ